MSSLSPARARVRLGLVVALLAAALSLTGFGPATDARAADGTATLSGTISGFDGRTLSSARVSVSQSGEHVAYAITEARGEYAVTGLAPGRYDVRISYCCSSAAYISEWGDGTHGATQVTPMLLTAGTNTLDVVLDAGGSITGTVTAAGKVEYATLALIPMDPIIPGRELRAGVGADGRIWSDPLPPGRYGIIADAGRAWQKEDHNGVKTTTPTEPALVVELGGTVSVSIDLEPAGEISGTVYIDNGDGTRRPAAGASVFIKPWDYYTDHAGLLTTDSNGRYVVRGVSGRYSMSFQTPYSLPEYYGGARERALQQLVTVPENARVSGIDATLELGGRISLQPRVNPTPGSAAQIPWTSGTLFYRIDEVTGARVLQDPTLSSNLDDAGSGNALPPGTYFVDVGARHYLGSPWDLSSLSPEFTRTIDGVVVEPGKTTNLGAVILETDYWGVIHPPANGSTPDDAGAFTSVDPTRLLDTRIGTGAPARALGPHQSVDLQITGRGPIPATGVGTAVLNVTATGATAGGFITAYPVGVSEAKGSSLNFDGGQTIANLVTVRVGAEGRVRLTNNSSGTVHLIADAAGYHFSGTPRAPGTFTGWRPARMMDTRIEFPNDYIRTLKPFETVRLGIVGRGGVPSTGVTSAAMNVTVTGSTAAGFLTAYPSGTSQPTASNLNFTRGQTIPNHVNVKVGSDGGVALTNNSPGTVDVIADLAGHYGLGTPTTKGAFVSLDPARLLDTRVGNGARNVAVGANETIDLQVTNRAGLPASGVSSVVMNVTVTDPKSGGFITAYPSGTARPTASNLNFTAGQTIPNLVTVKVGGDGRVSLTNSSSGTIHLIADVAGYYLSADQPIG